MQRHDPAQLNRPDVSDYVQNEGITLPCDTAPVPYSPQQLLKKYQNGLVIQRIRLYLLTVVTFCEVVLSLHNSLPTPIFPMLFTYRFAISFTALGVSLLLAIEVPIRAMADLRRAKISTYTLTTLAALLWILHCILSFFETAENYCSPLLLLLLFQYKSLVIKRSSMFHTLHTVCFFDSPMGIFETPQLLPNSDSLRRNPGNIADYIQKLQMPDLPQKVMGFYATLLLPVTLIIDIICFKKTSANFLLYWLLLLLCSIPCAGMLSYAFPSNILAKRLSRYGGALCGWHSANLFGGTHTIILRDEDLFPSTDCSSNGMKLFHGYRAEQVIPYALTLLESVDSPLTPLFRPLLTTPLRSPLPITEQRVYDNNGVGANINSTIVLVGTLAFMRSMGVHMPPGTQVRQAVYVSISGELAGIFAIRYKPNTSTHRGLKEVLANQNFSVILATRDFLISPELIASKYELPTDTLIYPKYSERLRLSSVENQQVSSQGALIAKDTFGAFAMTIAAGHALRTTSKVGLWFSIFSGLSGLLLCTLLLLCGTVSRITSLYLVAFQLLWAIVSQCIMYILLEF